MDTEIKKTKANLEKLKIKYPTKVPILINDEGKIIKILGDLKQNIDEILLGIKRTNDTYDDIFLTGRLYEGKGGEEEIPSDNTIEETLKDYGTEGIIICQLGKITDVYLDEEKKEKWIMINF